MGIPKSNPRPSDASTHMPSLHGAAWRPAQSRVRHGGHRQQLVALTIGLVTGWSICSLIKGSSSTRSQNSNREALEAATDSRQQLVAFVGVQVID